MLAERFESLTKGQTAIAQKVLLAVPVKDVWAAQRIRQELARTGHNIQPTVVDGCLAALQKAKLIRQPKPGCYQRAPTRVAVEQEKPALKVVEKPAAPVKAEVVAKKSGMDRLLEISDKLHGVQMTICAIANEIEEVAIEIEDEKKAERVNTEKLRKFSEALKSLALEG